MSLDELIISMYCRLDDELKIAVQRSSGTRLRARGTAPKLSDAEVLTMECVGEAVLGLDCGTHLFACFSRHYSHFFPALAYTCRTSFARHAANLWHVKEQIWRRLLAEAAPCDERLHIVDSMPLPVCRFARATLCQRFRGAAWYGHDHSGRQTFYGFRLHARLAWPGLIGELFVTAANQSEQSVLPRLASSASAGCAKLGDRSYASAKLRDRLAADGQHLLTPATRRAEYDPDAAKSKKWAYSDLRCLIDTVFGQFTDRLHVKSVWARDLWHLTSRICRKVLAHTLAVIVNMEQVNKPLQLHKLVQA